MNSQPRDTSAKSNVKWSEMEVTVIKADGTRVPYGVVSYYHKNPLKRLAYRLKNRFERNK